MSAADYSHRRVWHIAAPLIFSNATVPLLGIVDTAVVGHLDTPVYLGAVAIGATIFSFLFFGFNFLRMGTTGVAAQAFGTGDNAALRAVLVQSLAVAGALAVAIIALQGPVGELAIRLLDPEPDIARYALEYFHIRVWAAPAALANFALVGWFIGLQNGRAPLQIMLAVNAVNIVLDYVLVWRFGLNANGVAIASLCAEYTGLALGLLLVRRALRRHPGKIQRSDCLDMQRLRRLLSVNAALLVRTLSLMFAFGFLTAQGARQGSLILAANAVLLNLQYFMSYALDGFANAAEALIGRAFGARDRQGLDIAYRNTLIWSAGVAVVFTLAYLLAGGAFVDLMTDIPEVRAAAHTYLPWLIVSPLFSVWSFFYDGVYVGAVRAQAMRNTMVFCTFLVFVPLTYALGFLGNHGLWLAFIVFMAARGATLHLDWRRKPPVISTAD